MRCALLGGPRVPTSTEQVIVCAGAQQALNLVINTLISPGDLVGMEEPGYYGAKAAFQQAGARITPLLVDLRLPDARRQNAPALLYTTPTNQFPLGAAFVLPVLRRSPDKVARGYFRTTAMAIFAIPAASILAQGADNYHRVIYLGFHRPDAVLVA